MGARSAGILLFRVEHGRLEVLLAHPGGPLWAKKDLGAWSIPKGEHGGDEDPAAAALREFHEETGVSAPDGDLIALGEARLKSGKIVSAWGLEGELDVTRLRSNTFEMQWPPRSGKTQEFPEIDRAEWFDPETAREKINPAQAVFVDRLHTALHDAGRLTD